MKLKLDENLGQRLVALFEDAGHDVATVLGEGLCGFSDSRLMGRCLAEQRALVTLDLDFANPLIFRPSVYLGIAVFRSSGKLSYAELEHLCLTLINALRQQALIGKLWIVEPDRIREHQEEPD